MAISKNVLLGGGIIAIGLFLGYKAKRVGKQVIAIGGIIPTKQKPVSAPVNTNAELM